MDQFLKQVAGGGGANLSRIAEGLDLDRKDAAAAVNAVLAELTYNLERNSLSRGGLAQIIQSLGSGDFERYLKPEADLTTDDAVARGNELLGRIVQTKYQSRAIADRVERDTGVPAAKVRRMLPRIANLSMGALGAQSRTGLEDIFKKLPGFPGSPGQAPAAPAGQAGGQSPLPIPGDDWGGRSRNQYDDLSDVLTRRQGPFQTNPMWSIVRELLGTVLGFQSKGIVGWIIRFFLYRYGWTILKMIFGRMFRA